MIQGQGRIRRALWCFAGAVVVGVPSALITFGVLYWFNYIRQWKVLGIAIAFSLCLGIGAALGQDLALARQTGVATERPAGERIRAGIVAIVLLVLLGVLGGALAILLYFWVYNPAVIQTEIALAVVAFGITAAALLTRWHGDSAVRALLPLSVALAMLYTLSFVWSTLVTDCTRVDRCLITIIPWQRLLPQSIITVVLPMGAWLGMMLWGALRWGWDAASQTTVARPTRS